MVHFDQLINGFLLFHKRTLNRVLLLDFSNASKRMDNMDDIVISTSKSETNV